MKDTKGSPVNQSSRPTRGAAHCGVATPPVPVPWKSTAASDGQSLRGVRRHLHPHPFGTNGLRQVTHSPPRHPPRS